VGNVGDERNGKRKEGAVQVEKRVKTEMKTNQNENKKSRKHTIKAFL
jgi:hypothetical protein